MDNLCQCMWKPILNRYMYLKKSTGGVLKGGWEQPTPGGGDFLTDVV